MFIFEHITHTKLLQIIKNWPLSSKYVQELFHRHSFLWQKPTRQFFLHWQSVYSYTCINSSNLWKLKFLRSFTRVLSILIFFSVLDWDFVHRWRICWNPSVSPSCFWTRSHKPACVELKYDVTVSLFFPASVRRFYNLPLLIFYRLFKSHRGPIASFVCATMTWNSTFF